MIDLGPIKATREQTNRLLGYIGNQILSWQQFDVKDVKMPVTVGEGDQSWSSDGGDENEE